MDPPTLAGGEGGATLTLGPAPGDGGAAITRYDYQIDTGGGDFASPVAQGQQAPGVLGAQVGISPLAAGDYVARQRAVNDIGPGAWSPASAAAAVTEYVGTATVGIDASILTVTEGEPIHFLPESINGFGVDAATVKSYGDFHWSFSDDAAEDYTFDAMAAPSKLVGAGQNRVPITAGEARGFAAAHFYVKPGTHTVRLTVRCNGQVATATRTVTVVPLSATYPDANRVYVDPTGDFAGVPAGVPAGQRFTSIDDAMILLNADTLPAPSALFVRPGSDNTRNNYIAERVGNRCTRVDGLTWGQDSTDGSSYLGPKATLTRGPLCRNPTPTVELEGSEGVKMNSETSLIQQGGDNGEFFVFGIESVGSYDQENPSVWIPPNNDPFAPGAADNADFDCLTTLVKFANNGGTAPIRGGTFRCHAEGLGQMSLSEGGNPTIGIVFGGCSAYNCLNYSGVYASTTGRGGIVGCSFEDNPKGIVNGEGARDKNRFNFVTGEPIPNYADHGCVRLAATYGFAVNRSRFYASVNWAGGIVPQPLLRMSQTSDPWQSYVVTENEMRGGSTPVSAGPPNGDGIYPPTEQSQIAHNWIEMHGPTGNAYGTSYHGNGFFNNVVYAIAAPRLGSDVIVSSESYHNGYPSSAYEAGPGNEMFGNTIVIRATSADGSPLERLTFTSRRDLSTDGELLRAQTGWRSGDGTTTVFAVTDYVYEPDTAVPWGKQVKLRATDGTWSVVPVHTGSVGTTPPGQVHVEPAAALDTNRLTTGATLTFGTPPAAGELVALAFAEDDGFGNPLPGFVVDDDGANYRAAAASAVGGTSPEFFVVRSQKPWSNLGGKRIHINPAGQGWQNYAGGGDDVPPVYDGDPASVPAGLVYVDPPSAMSTGGALVADFESPIRLIFGTVPAGDTEVAIAQWQPDPYSGVAMPNPVLSTLTPEIREANNLLVIAGADEVLEEVRTNRARQLIPEHTVVMDPARYDPATYGLASIEAHVAALFKPAPGNTAVAPGIGRRSAVDFFGAVRPANDAVGALTEASDVTGWNASLPRLPTITASWPDGLNDGNVLGTDTSLSVVLTDAGLPAVALADVTVEILVDGVVVSSGPATGTFSGHTFATAESVSVRLTYQTPLALWQVPVVRETAAQNVAAPVVAAWVTNGGTRVINSQSNTTNTTANLSDGPTMTFAGRFRVTFDDDTDYKFWLTSNTTLSGVVGSNGEVNISVRGQKHIIAMLSLGQSVEFSLMVAYDSRTVGNTLGGVMAKIWLDGVDVTPAGLDTPDNGDIGLTPLSIGGGRTGIRAATLAIRGGFWVSDTAVLDPAVYWSDFFAGDLEPTNWPDPAGVPFFAPAGVQAVWGHWGGSNIESGANLGTGDTTLVQRAGTGSWLEE